MKRIFLASLVITITLLTSCKKNKNNCIISTAAISGFYKISKVTISGSDVTSTYLTPCQLSAQEQFYVDKTFNYQETSEPCGSGSASGTWSLDVNTNKISINSTGNFIPVNNATIVSWDCSTLVISGNDGIQDYVMTLGLTQKP